MANTVHSPLNADARAFTLVELLATIAILALIVTVAGVYIGDYVNNARTVTAKKNLAMLNDALTRYKGQGGDVKKLTVGASIPGVFTKLKTTVTWAGKKHQFLQSGFTYPARSLLAIGNHHQYRFYGYGAYKSETPSADTPTSTYPYSQGRGYIAKNPAGFWNLGLNSTSGVVCFQDASGIKKYYSVTTDPNSYYYPWFSTPSNSYTFWACASMVDEDHGDPTPSGAITYITANGNQLTSLNVQGLTGLQQLKCYSNQLTSLQVAGLSSLKLLWCDTNQLTSLNVSGCSSLEELEVRNNQLTSLNLSGATSLSTLYCDDNQLTSLNISALTNLEQFTCRNNQITTLNAQNLPNIMNFFCNNNQLTSIQLSSAADFREVCVAGNPALTGSAAALEALYNSLPTVSPSGWADALLIGDDAPSANDSLATGKNWTVSRAEH